MMYTYNMTPRAALVLLFGMAVLKCVADDSGSKEDTPLNSLEFNQAIWEAANDGMGLKGIQKAFDKFGEVSSRVPDWPAVTAQLANVTGERFRDFTVALTRLRQAIEAHYINSDDNVNIPMCCNITGARYQKAFKTEVDAHQICTRISTDAESNLDLPGEGFLREARKNSQGYPYIKWQYYGTEEGGLRLYPAFRVGCNFSPRIRPWYVETFAPDPKDIVIVVDGTNHGSSDLVKRSVLTIIDTTNPNDRIGVVRFGETASTPVGSVKTSTCYKTSLALATPANKKYLASYVSQTGRTAGAAKYIPALEKAFSLLSDTDDTSHNRRQVLLFFTHSDPDDALPEDTIKLVREQIVQNQHKNNTLLTILTYGAGIDPQSKTEELLQTLSNLSYSGSYTRLTSMSNLRYNLRSYYNTLSHPFEHSLFVLPYIDGWGLGLVISICQPFFHKKKFQGVVCLDGTLPDLLSDVINIRLGVEAYSFIVDNQGRTIHHPYLAQPNDDNKSNLNVHISMLERSEGPEAKEVIAAIAQGMPGGRSIRVPLPTARAIFPGQWVERRHVTKHYEWTMIPNTNYTLCIVSIGNDAQLNLTVPKQIERNYLNAHRIRDHDPCMHEGLPATTKKSSVSLDAKAFYKDCEDLSEDEMAVILTDYFTNEKDKERHDCIKDYVHDEVQLTGQADHVWKSEQSSKYNSTILWRHLITLGGVRRIYPAVHYHLHSPLLLPWYVKALSDVNTIVLTRSNVTKRIIITMSHVVYEGRTSGIHARHNLPVAVLAAEFRYSYIMDLMLGLMPSCQDEDHSCFLVDESGLVLLHTDVGEEQHDKLGHVLDMEPSIARRLISRGLLTSGNCTNVEHLRIQTFWRLSTPGVSVTDTYFEIQAISKTNMFIIQKDKEAVANGNTCPSCLNLGGDISPCKSCDNARTECSCPCYCDLQFDYCNYTFVSIEPFTCPLSVLPVSLEKDDPFQPDPVQYPKCFKDKECPSAKSESDCFLLPDCIWCLGEEENGYICTVPRQCRNPGSGGSGTTAAVVVILLLLLAFAAVVAITCYLRTRGYICVRTTWFQKYPGFAVRKLKTEDVYSNITEVVAVENRQNVAIENRHSGLRAPAIPPSGAHRWTPKGVENVAYSEEEKTKAVEFDNYYSNASSLKGPNKGEVAPKDPPEKASTVEVNPIRRDSEVSELKRRPPPIPTFPSSHNTPRPPSMPVTIDEMDSHDPKMKLGLYLTPMISSDFPSKVNLQVSKSAEARPNQKSVEGYSSHTAVPTPEANSSGTQYAKSSEQPSLLESDNGPEFHKHSVDLSDPEPKDYHYLSPAVHDQHSKDVQPQDSKPEYKTRKQDNLSKMTPYSEASDPGGKDISPEKRQDPDGEDEVGLDYLPMSARSPIISLSKPELPNT